MQIMLYMNGVETLLIMRASIAVGTLTTLRQTEFITTYNGRSSISLLPYGRMQQSPHCPSCAHN